VIRSSVILFALVLPAAITLAAVPVQSPPNTTSENPIAGVTLGVTAVDTTLLIGSWASGAPFNGQFQTPSGGPAWNGWTSADLSDPGGNHWIVSTRRAINGVYSAWCGDPDIPSCGPGDPEGGYGNGWDDIITWQAPVNDPALPCTVRVQAVVALDSEPGYDYGAIYAAAADGTWQLWYDWGDMTALPLDYSYVYEPGDYVGNGTDEVRIEFRFFSDGAGSDEDCLYFHSSAGAMNLDDVVITLSNGAGYSHDFEDGTWGDLVAVPRYGAGDYASIRMGLDDIDPCHENPSPQVAFIDDGIVVPGTGGTTCLDWCYGPGGYVLHHSGGLSYEDIDLWNVVLSPPLALPPGADDVLLEFDIFRHDDFAWTCADPSCMPNILPWEGIRSVATGNPADLDDADWVGPDYLTLAEPGTYRMSRVLGHKLVPGATHFQVALGLDDLSQEIWPGNQGENSSPAPYYDNVRVAVSPRPGPTMSTYPHYLARDGFPASGVVDTGDLGANSVRFDMIADPEWVVGKPAFIAGDSVMVRIAPRDGGGLVGTPRMHYRLFRNDLFDPHRTSGLPDLGFVDMTDGTGDEWAADLPDQGFLFPGDRLHYYFTAEDDLGGDVRLSILPADTTGFSEKWGSTYAFAFDPAFTMRALPTVYETYEPGTYTQPSVLLWHDSGTDEDWDKWLGAMQSMIGMLGEDFDIFDAKSTDAVGRTMSTAATVAQLETYDQVIYAGGLEDTSLELDLPLLESWLLTDSKDIFLTGHQIAGDLEGGFATWTGLSLADSDTRLLVGDQMAPRVRHETGNPVLATLNSWLAFGECPDMAPAAAVTTTGNGMRLAQYMDAQDNPDMYPYAAMILNVHAGTGSRVITLPWDFSHVHTDPLEGEKAKAMFPARVRMLYDVVSYFGVLIPAFEPTDTPVADTFAVSPYPNPFNPATTINYTIERPGHLSLRVYDLRGALVATLMDGRVEQSGSVAWDGTNAAGATVASGVYFYEARMHGEVQVGKLALLK